MSLQRLVLFVEGQGDFEAVPVLVKKILTEISAWEYLTLDYACFRVGGVDNLTGRSAHKRTDWLKAAVKRQNVGGILLVLDGDRDYVLADESSEKEAFCAAKVARQLAERARETGAGSEFSVACVFARQEFESWLLAGIDSLRGNQLPDGRPGIKAEAPSLERDTNSHPRDAKKWLAKQMPHGYKPSTDQHALTELVSLDSIRERNPRSFQRFQHAISELCEAIRRGRHMVSPAS